MEIHTPNDFNFNNLMFKLGHRPDYLDGLVNIVYMNKADDDSKVDTMPDTIKYSYLDYVMADKKGDDDIAVLGLKLFVKDAAKEIHTLEVQPDLDNERILQDHLSYRVLNKIDELSLKFKEEVSSHFTSGLDVDLTGDSKVDGRKVIARMLACGNMIAAKARRGPSNFIMIGEQYLDYLRIDNSPTTVPFYRMDKTTTYMTVGMKLFVSPFIGNKVIVGRCPDRNEEPGLHLVTTENDISGDILFEDEKQIDISHLRIAYSLIESGEYAHRNYLQFNINSL